MSYYPLSQITANLFTNGGEYSTSLKNQSISYKGYYWKTSKNQFFTGKTPQDTPSVELYLIKPTDSSISEVSTLISNIITSDDSQPDLINYANLKNISLSQVIFLPNYSPNIPTQQDYQIGEYRRYFCKKTNEIIYLEINKDTYDKLVNKDSKILYQLYQPFNLPWQLTGDKSQVFITNKNITELTIQNLKLPMFSEYLKNDFTKYYK
jgi:hypothetical protein